MEEKVTLRERIESLKNGTKQKFEDVKQWCKEHQNEALVLAPVVISGTIEVFKIVMKRKNLSEERSLKENFIYDRSMGHYYELRRKLKSSEWIQIEKRKLEGRETLGEILQDMNVLKK